ncbi:MAG: hypothetical protein ABSG64_08190 [Solirubrobacteraceae bacterium]|jgi:hypothetical protein
MPRCRLLVLATCAVLLAPSGAAGAQLSQSLPQTEPAATNVHYRSTLLRVSPVVRGVSWKVLDYNDEIDLVNASRQTVTVFGYLDEPYLRILPDGSVQLNESSPAYYLNQSFYANPAAVPASVTTGYPPDWVTVAKTGSFVWHDHRIHYYSSALPADVHNVRRTTLVERWTVPIEVGSVKGKLYGKLVWIGEQPFAFPLAAIIAFIVIVLAGAAFVIVVRRRRARGQSTAEAW